MLTYRLTLFLFLASSLSGMQLSSLRHLSLKKLCETVDTNINLELIHTLITRLECIFCLSGSLFFS